MQSKAKKRLLTVLSVSLVVMLSVMLMPLNSRGMDLIFTWIPAIFFSEDKNLVSAIRENSRAFYLFIVILCCVIALYHLLRISDPSELAMTLLESILVIVSATGFVAWRRTIWRWLGVGKKES